MVATIVKRNSLFFVTYSTGCWTKATIKLLISNLQDVVQQPTNKQKITFFTDGNNDYQATLPKYFHKDSIHYGQYVKSKNGKKIWPPIRRKVYGNPNRKEICTNNVECFNTILRARISRLVRKTQCHAKAWHALDSAVGLFQFYWNFMYEREKNLTPAILEGQASKVWTWGNFLHAKLKYPN